MINELLRIIAPHYCYGCAKVGMPLCANCKYDIIDEAVDACIVCIRPSPSGICKTCITTYERAWCVGERSDTLERLINAYKFERVKDAADSLASLLDARLPVLPAGVVIVPVPTIPAHIRQRGYDHVALIARCLGRRRGIPVQTLIGRGDFTMQRGQDKKTRFTQAKAAFSCNQALGPTTTFLLVDDVVTTNATVRYASASLREAGARHVWVATIARQPLDKPV